MGKIKVDLHECFRDSGRIDEELEGAIAQALEKRIPLVEIISGKGSGQLRKRVIRFLQNHPQRGLFRVDKDNDNHGRLFVRFR